MAPDSQREKSLFNAAQDITDPARQRAFLEEACGGDQGLRVRIDRLLKASETADDFLAGCAPALEAAAVALDPSQIIPAQGVAQPTDEKPGSRIGPYKLLEKIGEGGCGIVYMAEQERPVRRRVALKVIKLGMDTKTVIARFEAERQALAMMNHPNIARVLDAGATEAGRPYFVMELVYGNKITDYCDQKELPVSDRLKIFIQVCQGIQHAHQKGIIHRDIKPSNILVTMLDGVPVPKVIDFGIAKATEQSLTDKTLFTSYAQLIGTPAYMSPEQMELSGQNLDTRSDIYCLGVLLYELLTGRTPFDTAELLKDGVDEMRRTLREREPSSPSAKLRALSGEELTKTALQRQVDPRRFQSHLRGDLDRIVMKCLEKNRNRRYETANGLAMDIQRHLNDEPVLARAPSRWYRFQKLVQRNQMVFLAGGAVGAALLIGTVTSTSLLIKERAALRRADAAQQEAEKARATEAQLRREAETREKITQAALLAGQGNYLEAEALLGELMHMPSKQMTEALRALGSGETRTTGFLAEAHEVAKVLRTLGDWQAVNGRWPQAAERFGTLAKLDPLDDWNTVTIDYTELGCALIESGDQKGYEQFRQETIARFAGSTNPVADRIIKLSLLLPANQQTFQDLQPQIDAAEKSFASATGTSARNPSWAAWNSMSLALLQYRRGDYTKAAEWGRRGLAFPQKNRSRDAALYVILAMSCWQMNQYQEAEAELSKGQKLIETKFKNGLDRGNGNDGFWFDWVCARILLRECQQLIGTADYSLAQLSVSQPSLEIAAQLRALGEWNALNGRWQQAAERFATLVKVDQLDSWETVSMDLLKLGPALIESGDTNGYERFRQTILTRFDDKTNYVTDRIIKISLLLPANQELIQTLVPQAEISQKLYAGARDGTGQNAGTAVWRAVSLALFEYRRGNYAEGASWCRFCLAYPNHSAARDAAAHVILAMSCWRMNQPQAAQSEFSQGREMIETKFKGGLDQGNAAQGFWFDWVFARILLHEASELVGEVHGQTRPAAR